MKRKDFLRASALVTGGIFLNNFFPLNAKNIFSLEGFKEVAPGIGIYTERGGTIGYYLADDVTVVIDSQFPDAAKNFHSGLIEKQHKKISFLFNTHHHRDHTAGNTYLNEFAEDIIAHENCVELQKKNNSASEAGSIFKMILSKRFIFVTLVYSEEK